MSALDLVRQIALQFKNHVRIPFSDSAMEQTIRLRAILLSMAVQAYVVNVRYRWARPQNGGPLPEMRDLLFFAALPVLMCVVGYMGLRLRIWSWSFVVFCAGGSWWIVSQALADQGLFWTRISYFVWRLDARFKFWAGAVWVYRCNSGVHPIQKAKRDLAIALEILRQRCAHSDLVCRNAGRCEVDSDKPSGQTAFYLHFGQAI